MSLHNYMQNKLGWYANWHNHPRHNFHHFLVFISLTIIVFCGLITKIDSFAYSYYGEEPVLKASTGQLNNQLIRAIKNYEQAEESEKPNLLRDISDIVKKREIELGANVKNNPSKALLDLLPQSAIENMPTEIQAMLEKHVSVSGKLNLDILENIETEYSENVYTLEETKTKKEYRLRFANGEPKAKVGSQVQVTGVEFADNLVLNSADNSSLTQIADAYAGEPASALRTLVILVNFSNNLAQTYTPAQVAGMMFTNPLSVNEYYKANSNGLTSFVGDVTSKYFTLPNTSSYYCTNYRVMATEAQNAAAAAGYTLSNYDRIGILMPSSGCSWGGMSSVWPGTMNGYTTSIFQAYGATSLVQLMIHEFGHGLSLRHASSISCGSKSIDVSTSCTTSEYGEKYDPMGYYNAFHTNLPHSIQIPWINTGNVKSVSSDGTYTIAPVELVTNEIQGLKIYKKDTGTYYYVSYRQPIGLDVGLPAGQTSGALIHTWGSAQTFLVDGTPGDSNFANAALIDGGKFTDAINGITITQVTHSTSSVTVQVAFTAPACVKTAPTMTISPVSQSASSGKSLTYNLTLKNNDGAGCAPANFNFSTVLPANFSSTFSQNSLSLAAGSSQTNQIVVTSTTTQTEGSYQFKVDAKDSLDASHATSASGTYVVYNDISGPIVTIISPKEGSIIPESTLEINVSATDPSGISKVEIYFDGSLKVTDKTAPYIYKLNTRKVTAGTHVVKVKAYDNSGSFSEASVTVQK